VDIRNAVSSSSAARAREAIFPMSYLRKLQLEISPDDVHVAAEFRALHRADVRGEHSRAVLHCGKIINAINACNPTGGCALALVLRNCTGSSSTVSSTRRPHSRGGFRSLRATNSLNASNMTTAVTILKRVARVVLLTRRFLEVNSRSSLSQVSARQGQCIARRANRTAVTMDVT